MAELKTASGEPAGYNYGFTAQMGAVTAQIMGIIPATAGKKEIDETFDLVSASLNRQLAKASLPGLEAEVEKIDRTVANLRESIAMVDEKWKHRPKLPDNEAANKSNLEVTLRDLQAKRNSAYALLDKTRKEAE